jgi:hypothetical protein
MKQGLFALLLLGLMLSSSQFARALTTEQSIYALLQGQENMQGLFKQSKTLSGLSFPLHSDGEFFYLKGIGLYSKTLQPFVSASSFSKQGIKHWDSTGNIISKEESPADKHISRLLLALFSGDNHALEEMFSIQGHIAADDNWQLALTPSHKMLKEHIQSITLSGSKQLEQINILSQNNDKTLLQFFDFKALSPVTKNHCQKFPESHCEP